MKIMLSKALVFTVIVLFIGSYIIPSTGNVVKESIGVVDDGGSFETFGHNGNIVYVDDKGVCNGYTPCYIYYIDATNGNDSWSGILPEPNSEYTDGPWKTISKVTGGSFNPGDSILFKRGEAWNNTLWLHSKGNNILLGAYGNNYLPKPVINADSAYAISLRDCNNWTIQDIMFQDGSSLAQVYVYAQTSNMSGIKLLRLDINATSNDEITTTRGIQFTHQNSGYHIDDVEIGYCNIYSAGAPQASGNIDGINIWSIRSDAYIHHNTIYDCNGDGIDVAGGDNHVVDSNKIDNVKGNGIKVHGQQYPLNEVVIRRNIVFKNCEGYGMGITIQDSTNGTVIANSVFMASEHGNYAAMHFLEPNIPGSFYGNIIKNNICYGNPIYNYGCWKVEEGIIDDFNTANTFGTNDIYTTNAKIIQMGDTGTDITYDNWQSEWLPNHAGDINKNPLFTDASNGDFHLQPTSPCIDAGTDVGLTEDFEGNPVPYGSAPDIGAYEYNSDVISGFTYTPTEPTTQDIIQFTDTSIDPDGYIESWDWDFGDGETSTLQNPVHQYADDGEYTVSLTVFDDYDNSDEISKIITVNNVPPTPYIDSISPNPANEGTTVTFIGHGEDPDGEVTTYAWESDKDGQLYAGSNPSFSIDFPSLGTHTISLMVRDDDFDWSEPVNETLIIREQGENNPPNTPSITGPVSGEAGEEYDYTFNSVDPDGNNVQFYIEWGNGNEWTEFLGSGEDITISHSWNVKNDYIIRAKAKDINGAESDWATLEISMPKNKVINPFILFLERLIEQFPILEQILQPIYNKLVNL
jgi:PKD repeat protein